jgi:hypothetical protein
MNPALLLQALITGGGKGLAILQDILSAIGPATTELGPDVAALIADANKLMTDLIAIFGKLQTTVTTSATGTPPAA